MKVNLIKISFLFYLLLLTNGKIYAQATDGLPATGNVYTAAKFLGWGATSGDLNFRTNNTTRMVIKNTTGLVGMGNNLAGFTPVDQFQLYQNVSTFLRMRFTHAGTGSTNTDGTSISISGGTDGNGNPISPDFRISQHEKANVDIFTLNNGESNVIRRFRVAPNGQVFIPIQIFKC